MADAAAKIGTWYHPDLTILNFLAIPLLGDRSIQDIIFRRDRGFGDRQVVPCNKQWFIDRDSRRLD
jgi:hypothetical protein